MLEVFCYKFSVVFLQNPANSQSTFTNLNTLIVHSLYISLNSHSPLHHCIIAHTYTYNIYTYFCCTFFSWLLLVFCTYKYQVTGMCKCVLLQYFWFKSEHYHKKKTFLPVMYIHLIDVHKWGERNRHIKVWASTRKCFSPPWQKYQNWLWFVANLLVQ